MLQLDIGDLDAPGVGLRIEDIRRRSLLSCSLGKHLVERVPSTDGWLRTNSAKRPINVTRQRGAAFIALTEHLEEQFGVRSRPP